MKFRRNLLTIALTAAFAFGVWTLAVSFTSANFADGDVLSAQQLNDLLNDNFTATETAINKLTEDKLDKSGGKLSGRLSIEASSDNAALALKNTGSGPVFTAIGRQGFGASVLSDGSIQLGAFSAAGRGTETIRIEAETGTITNQVGSGLPLAFGYVDAGGRKRSGTSNFTSRRLPGKLNEYEITLTGETYSREGFSAIVTPHSPRIVQAYVQGNNKLGVKTTYYDGRAEGTGFHFVVFKDGN